MICCILCEIATNFRFIFAAFYETTTAGRSYQAPTSAYGGYAYDQHNRVKRRVEGKVGEAAGEAANEAGNSWSHMLNDALVGKRLSRVLRSFADAAESFDRWVFLSNSLVLCHVVPWTLQVTLLLLLKLTSQLASNGIRKLKWLYFQIF